MSIAETNIARSISTLGFRMSEQMHRKSREAAASRLAETDQQFQIEVSGEAAQAMEWETIDLTFDETIYIAPAQRTSPLSEPHFTFGSTMQSDTPVILVATVQKWLTDSTGNFIGATVHLGVSAMNEGATLVKYRATVHLVFQGLSSPNYPATGTGEG